MTRSMAKAIKRLGFASADFGAVQEGREELSR